MPASCRRCELRPQPSDAVVADLDPAASPSPRPRRAVTPIGTDDDERVAPPGAARRDEVRDADTGALGEQGDEALVLDELDARLAGPCAGCRGTRRSRHSVDEQLAVPGVAAVHLDRQRAVGVVTVEEHGTLAAASMPGARSSTSTPSSWRASRMRGGVRASARRAEGEVHASRSQQTDGDGGDAARRPTWRRGTARPTNCSRYSHRPRWRNGRLEVGRGRRDRRRGQRQETRRERRRVVGVGETAEDSPPVVERRPHRRRRRRHAPASSAKQEVADEQLRRRTTEVIRSDGRPCHRRPHGQPPEPVEETRAATTAGRPTASSSWVATCDSVPAISRTRRLAMAERDVRRPTRPRLVLRARRTAAGRSEGATHASSSACWRIVRGGHPRGAGMTPRGR